jgi:hypothetical protein
MRKWYLALFILFFTLPAWSDTNVEALLNKVTLRLNAEQWVTTKTALVTIGINVSVSDNDLGKAQSHIMDKLNQLAGKAEWHILSIDRSQDQSGLEKIQASATARLPDNELAGIREKAKAISKPGETFTLDNVQFVPTEDEVRNANAVLRSNIYQQAKTELDQLNKLYPDQKYYIHQINFISDVVPGPMMQAKFSNGMIGAAANTQLDVGDKLRISAVVTLSAAPNQDVVKLVHN